MLIALRRLPSALQRWILQAGAMRATIVVTLVAVIASVGLTWLCMLALDGGRVPLHLWLVAATTVPLAVSPIVFGLVIFMAYELDQAKSALALAACTDALTGVANRRGFMAEAGRTIETARREGRPLPSLLVLDVDHFKRINDRYGHMQGDEVLRRLVQCCTASLRETDVFARLGGEEFVALLPETDTQGAMVVAEKLRRDVAALSFAPDGPNGITISIGIGGVEDAAEDIDALLSLADRQLYRAKRAGRNRVSVLRVA